MRPSRMVMRDTGNAPTRIRTWGLLLRRESLYPAELSGPVCRLRLYEAVSNVPGSSASVGRTSSSGEILPISAHLEGFVVLPERSPGEPLPPPKRPRMDAHRQSPGIRVAHLIGHVHRQHLPAQLRGLDLWRRQQHRHRQRRRQRRPRGLLCRQDTPLDAAELRNRRCRGKTSNGLTP
jgi:hypothetical protein